MTIKFYTNLSDKVVVDKNITQLGSDVTGTLREGCSIIDPIIKFEGTIGSNLTTANYCYITEFGRYYYINNIKCVGKLFEVQMHVDVLMSFKNGIRANTAVISRQEHAYNLYLQDGVFKTYSQPHIQVAQFPNGFSDFEFIFSVAGG